MVLGRGRGWGLLDTRLEGGGRWTAPARALSPRAWSSLHRHSGSILLACWQSRSSLEFRYPYNAVWDGMVFVWNYGKSRGGSALRGSLEERLYFWVTEVSGSVQRAAVVARIARLINVAESTPGSGFWPLGGPGSCREERVAGIWSFTWNHADNPRGSQLTRFRVKLCKTKLKTESLIWALNFFADEQFMV